MSPTQAILHQSAATFETTDKVGRRLLIKRPTALDTLRLFKAAGPLLAQNEPWLAVGSLACSVREIDGLPVPPPTTEGQIEALVERLGDEGLASIAEATNNLHADTLSEANVGNLPGTLS